MVILLASILGFAVAAALAYAKLGGLERMAFLMTIAAGQALFTANYERGTLYFGGDAMGRTAVALLIFLVIDYVVYRIASGVRDRA